MKWDERGISLARLVSGWSKDPSTRVGAAIFDLNHRVLGVGYNGFARGIDDDDKLLDRDEKYPRIIHAEINAILNSHGEPHTMYCSLAPCAGCSGPIIQAGIKRVVAPFVVFGRWSESQLMAKDDFESVGVEVYYF